MSARLYAVAGALLLALMLAVPALAAESFLGEVQSVTVGQLTLMLGTEHLTFTVPEDAKVTLDGAEIKLENLQPGQPAKVTAEKSDDGTWIAQEVAATSN